MESDRGRTPSPLAARTASPAASDRAKRIFLFNPAPCLILTTGAPAGRRMSSGDGCRCGDIIRLEETMLGVSLIMPAYNEEKGIAPVIGDIASVGRSFENFEMIVVDDGSSDRTGEIAEASGVRVVRHAVNKGYGAS